MNNIEETADKKSIKICRFSIKYNTLAIDLAILYKLKIAIMPFHKLYRF